MSSFEVKLVHLEIESHPNADALELAKVGEYRAVVPKGQYTTGSLALYIPEQAVLPDELIEELGLTGKLAGKAKNRVKAIRLRGELSQGIVCRPKKVFHPDGAVLVPEEPIDYAERLGIEKWVPEVPASMSGDVEPAPDLVRWIDIENIKKFPQMFHGGKYGEEVVATEKVHGTCFCLTYVVAEDRFLVTSKGLGFKNLALVESHKNVYWRAVEKFGVKDTARELAKDYPFAKTIAIFGEVYGEGIQDLHYGVKGTGFLVFDVRIDWKGHFQWLDSIQLASIMTSMEYGQQTAPILYVGQYDYEALCELATGDETISGTGAHLREGLVVRALTWDGAVDPPGDRPIVKFINPDYLVRKGGTEYE